MLFLFLTKQVMALNAQWITTNRIDSGIAQSPIDIFEYTTAKCPDVKYQINYSKGSTVHVTNKKETSRLYLHIDGIITDVVTVLDSYFIILAHYTNR